LSILLQSHLQNRPRLTSTSDDPSDSEAHAKACLVKLLNYQDSEGSTPLQFTALNNFTEQARLLLSYGAKLEAPQRSKTQALLEVVKSNSHSTLKLLLQLAAKMKFDVVDLHDADGILHSAAQYGDMETMRILTEFGICCIDIDKLNNSGLTPLQVFDDLRFVAAQIEDEAIRSQSREAFLRLLDSVRPPSPNHSCWKNGEVVAADTKKSEVVSDLADFAYHESEDEEDYFDALSVVEVK